MRRTGYIVQPYVRASTGNITCCSCPYNACLNSKRCYFCGQNCEASSSPYGLCTSCVDDYLSVHSTTVVCYSRTSVSLYTRSVSLWVRVSLLLQPLCNSVDIQCSVLGVSCCYGLSYSFGRGLVFMHPNPICEIPQHGQSTQRQGILVHALIPNWLVNL